MKRIIKIMWAGTSLLFAANAFAGVCSNASLSGSYSFGGMLDRTAEDGSYYSSYLAGQFIFSGEGDASTTGGITFYGRMLGTNMGSWFNDNLSIVLPFGVYSVSEDCIATGEVCQKSDYCFSFKLYLDRMDFAAPVRLAYHANAVMRLVGLGPDLESSISGELDRIDSKF